jgi:hypothetical protein
MDNDKFTYTLWKEIDLAAAVTAKGSALAAADVIEVLRIPAFSMIIGAWGRKSAALAGTVSVCTVNVGVTGVNATGYGNGWDLFAAAVDTFSTPISGAQPILTTDDTIDVVIATLTGTLTGGKIIVGAVVADLHKKARGIIATPKS